MTTIRSVLALFVLMYTGIATGQAQEEAEYPKVYKVNPWMSGGIGLVGAYANFRGLPKVKDKPKLSLSELDIIVADGVGWLNRAGLRQDPSRREQAHQISDFMMYGTASLPLFLFADKRIKAHFGEVSLLYLETLSLTSNLYTYSPLGPRFNDRYRPLAFYEEVGLEERQSGNQRNSFYSGHVATTATGAFFVAKVLHDYHPEWGAKRVWLFAGAAVPTTVVGVLRLRALKHFPTDLLIGGAIGAGMGVLIPELHRRWQGRLRMHTSYTQDWKQFRLAWQF